MARYADLRHDEILDLAGHFGVRPLDSGHIDGGKANTSYEITDGERRYVLTVMNDVTAGRAEQMTRGVELLATHGVAVSTPLRTAGGASFVLHDGQPVMVRRYVEGNCEIDFPRELSADAGACLARIHLIPPFEGLPERTRHVGEADLNEIREHAPAGFVDWAAEILDATQAAGDFDGPAGLAHGDFWPDNVVINEGDLVTIDYETISNNLFIDDIAWALAGFAAQAGAFDPDRAQRFLRGYERVRPLSTPERDVIGDAVVRSAAAVALRRVRRHYLAFPNPDKHDAHLESMAIADSARMTNGAWVLEKF